MQNCSLFRLYAERGNAPSGPEPRASCHAGQCGKIREASRRRPWGNVMNLLLISPSNDGRAKTTNGFKFSQLTLHVLASLTPPDFEVSAVDEDIDDIDYSQSADLVGITCMTATAR